MISEYWLSIVISYLSIFLVPAFTLVLRRLKLGKVLEKYKLIFFFYLLIAPKQTSSYFLIFTSAISQPESKQTVFYVHSSASAEDSYVQL